MTEKISIEGVVVHSQWGKFHVPIGMAKISFLDQNGSEIVVNCTNLTIEQQPDYYPIDGPTKSYYFDGQPLYPLDPAIQSGKYSGNEVVAVLRKMIPGLEKMRAACPACAHLNENTPLLDTVIHLNDYHHWDRDLTADWLESLGYDLTLKPPEEQKQAHGYAGEMKIPVPGISAFFGSDSVFSPESTLETQTVPICVCGWTPPYSNDNDKQFANHLKGSEP